jgi:hypothetical protein
MTRKDYVLIAQILEQTFYLNESQRLTIARDFADELGMANRAFDRDRFLTACGVK